MVRRIPVILDADEMMDGTEEGYIIGLTFFREVSIDSERMYFKGGYALPNRLLDRLVDENIEYVCLIEPYQRLTSALTDWQDYGREAGELWEEGWTGLPKTFMASK